LIQENNFAKFGTTPTKSKS